MISLRSRYILIPLLLSIATLGLLSLRLGNPLSSSPPPPPPPPADEKPPIRYKPKASPPPPPLPEYFPLAASASSHADIPPVPSWNKPPSPHVPEHTRLFIGFTRFWPLLQQAVVAYIAAGWPPEDVYVIENTGTFDSNKKGLLTSQNPFYLDHKRLTDTFGVNVITMPSLQTFAQLQNFYLSEALNHNLSYYFWGHMDVVPLSHEDMPGEYKSLYQLAVEKIRECTAEDYQKDPATGEKAPWAIQFFAYDWLALVNAESFAKIGGWDSMVGYYGTDCDMHGRIGMNGMTMPVADAGDVFDVDTSMDDLELLFRRKKKRVPSSVKRAKEEDAQAKDDAKGSAGSGSGSGSVDGSGSHAESESSNSTSSKASSGSSKSSADDAESSDPSSSSKTSPPFEGAMTHGANSKSDKPFTKEIKAYLEETEEDERGGPGFVALKEKLQSMQKDKQTSPERNSWQKKQRGGEGEPFYYDPDGWEKALQMTIEAGLKINEEKWGHRGCDLRAAGFKEGDQWKVEHDW
ncbi:uncharacterized protein KY384_003429 [Bacidia gigantensis]|uniref:uncharacterized protein n=1 Tax=Bacidia gigantensis TaxID=2732470 RepID=UPI001D052D9C|nr:uncharacterized protein KY384_003429 [Bacidia gigantensis]KAG8531793.1 hypothetical protein KY384_003429 [Bacidia gigantensis]